jgi:hypothetical protein
MIKPVDRVRVALGRFASRLDNPQQPARPDSVVNIAHSQKVNGGPSERSMIVRLIAMDIAFRPAKRAIFDSRNHSL